MWGVRFWNLSMKKWLSWPKKCVFRVFSENVRENVDKLIPLLRNCIYILSLSLRETVCRLFEFVDVCYGCEAVKKSVSYVFYEFERCFLGKYMFFVCFKRRITEICTVCSLQGKVNLGSYSVVSRNIQFHVLSESVSVKSLGQ